MNEMHHWAQFVLEALVDWSQCRAFNALWCDHVISCIWRNERLCSVLVEEVTMSYVVDLPEWHYSLPRIYAETSLFVTSGLVTRRIWRNQRSSCMTRLTGCFIVSSASSWWTPRSRTISTGVMKSSSTDKLRFADADILRRLTALPNHTVQSF